jgi:hypothetical protein
VLASIGSCQPALIPLRMVAQHCRWPSSVTSPFALGRGVERVLDSSSSLK